MPRVTRRGFEGRGELETRLNADFEGEVVAVFEIIVSDSGGEGTEKLEDTVEVDSGCYRVVRAYLPVESKLECAAAVVRLDVCGSESEIIDIQLLPDGSHTSANKRLEGSFSGPAENSVDLNWNLE